MALSPDRQRSITKGLHTLDAQVPVMIAKLNKAIKSFEKLRDPSYGRSINLAGLERARTLRTDIRVRNANPAYSPANERRHY